MTAPELDDYQHDILVRLNQCELLTLTQLTTLLGKSLKSADKIQRRLSILEQHGYVASQLLYLSRRGRPAKVYANTRKACSYLRFRLEVEILSKHRPSTLLTASPVHTVLANELLVMVKQAAQRNPDIYLNRYKTYTECNVDPTPIQFADGSQSTVAPRRLVRPSHQA